MKKYIEIRNTEDNDFIQWEYQFLEDENEYDQEMLDYETEIVQNYVYLFGESDLYLDYLELEKEQ